MKESEEDISARAEAYTKETMFKLGEYKRKEFTNAYIEGYKSCLAAQSQSVEESKADLKVKCHDCNGTGNTQDFLTQVFGAEEDHCNRCSGTGVEIISNLKVSEERKYTKEEMEKAIDMARYGGKVSTYYSKEQIIESLPSAPIKKNEI